MTCDSLAILIFDLILAWRRHLSFVGSLGFNMLSSDALFTLNSSLEHDNSSIGIKNPSVTAAGVTGVCFVKDPIINSRSEISSINYDTDSDDNDSDSNSTDDDEHLQFKCSNLLLGPTNNNKKDTSSIQPYYHVHQQATHLSAASHTSLSGAVLASCHQDGSCKLWDLATRRCTVSDICVDYPRGGSGLSLRRIGTSHNNTTNQFLYQTRDPLGTVSLHDMNRPCNPVVQLYTYSSTFCAMSPCQVGNNTNENHQELGGLSNLVALPTAEHSVAVVRDLRCKPESNPAWKVDIGGSEYINSSMYGSRRRFGMLTSLALCLQETTQRVVLGCGMENGEALFYDLGAGGHRSSSEIIDPNHICSVSLGKDPVLTLDLVSSIGNNEGSSKKSTSLVAVGGCAGDANEAESELPEHDQGTVSTIKVSLATDISSQMKASIRTKTRTCSLQSDGKVGVSICRFRSDGRIFGVGGWDHRLRIFGISSSKPLAILRGHGDSVTAMDWSRNAALSGLLATGSGDGKMCLWRVYPHSLKK